MRARVFSIPAAKFLQMDCWIGGLLEQWIVGVMDFGINGVAEP
jgi:hypothetical protein